MTCGSKALPEFGLLAPSRITTTEAQSSSPELGGALGIGKLTINIAKNTTKAIPIASPVSTGANVLDNAQSVLERF